MSVRVLVVDDDDEFRGLISRVLSSWGNEVVGATGSVAGGIREAVGLRPDTVLVDLSLPDGDGFELARRLSLMAYPPRVVLISSDPEAADLASAANVGAAGFFAKETLTDRGFRDMIARP